MTSRRPFFAAWDWLRHEYVLECRHCDTRERRGLRTPAQAVDAADTHRAMWHRWIERDMQTRRAAGEWPEGEE